MSTSETPPVGQFDPAALVGTQFADRFRVLRVVSEGANTAVFDADDEESGRTVTLKLVRPRLASSPSFRNRFDETIRSAAALSHPNIAAIFDWGIARLGDASTAFVVIEQLTGGSLRDMFDRGRRLSPSQALSVGLEACRGLDYAHRRGFVHGELTPSKLVFGDDRRLRIIDFGLARLLGEQAWQQPDSVSTHVAWYASPEQGTGGPVDGATDVYALCLALQEAVTGTLPFRHDSTVASLAARVGKLMPVSADLGPLAAVFERAGRPEPDERSTAAEFGKGLVQAATKLPRPEPLPVFSTGLFDTPLEQLRSPDDPTGGVRRPPSDDPTPAAPVVVVPLDEPHAPAPPSVDVPGEDDRPESADTPEVPEPPEIIEAEPDAELPSIADGELVIHPLDSGIDEAPGSDAGDAAPLEPESDEWGATTAELPGATGGAGLSISDAPETRVMAAYVPESVPRRRRSVPWKVLLGLLVVAALAVLGVLATRLFRTPVYLVPDLVELPEAEARNLVATNGWEITIERERSDVVPVVGQVVRTAPQADVELAEGEPFLIVVSAGPTLRELPESTGLPAGEAQTRLVERGLVAEPIEEFDEVVPPGVVVSWSVPGDPTLGAGSMVEPETVVRLVVSRGPEPRIVPNLVGMTVAEGRAELGELVLEFVERDPVFSDDVPLGTIISQELDPGTEVERGTEVAVVVSKGPDLVRFPDLSGAATFEAAAELLRAAGFEPRLVFGDTLGQLRSVTIDGEEPGAGETFRRGTQVDIEAL